MQKYHGILDAQVTFSHYRTVASYTCIRMKRSRINVRGRRVIFQARRRIPMSPLVQLEQLEP